MVAGINSFGTARAKRRARNDGPAMKIVFAPAAPIQGETSRRMPASRPLRFGDFPVTAKPSRGAEVGGPKAPFRKQYGHCAYCVARRLALSASDENQGTVSRVFARPAWSMTANSRIHTTDTSGLRSPTICATRKRIASGWTSNTGGLNPQTNCAPRRRNNRGLPRTRQWP